MRFAQIVVAMRRYAGLHLALLLVACAPLPGTGAPDGRFSDQTLVLISLDGFHSEYLERHRPPALTRLASEGVVADWMIPAFPTLTFPNHYSIVTGLHPEQHGIVNNNMYDPVFDASFSLRNDGPREGRWWGGEPIWSTAEKQGVRAAAFFWPGTEAEVAGARPSRWMPYDGSVPFSVRVDSVLTWLSLPDAERPRMITLYFEEPDHTGHEDGPHASSIRGAVLKSDSALARLVSGLESRGLNHRVNLIVVSDHGMAEVSTERLAPVSRVIDTSTVRIVASGAVLMGWSKTGDHAGMVAALNRLPHVTAWLKEDVPARLRFRNHRRITPVVALADPGWMIVATDTSRMTARGMHGYDNVEPAMRALFVAWGPAFRSDARIPPFANVDVYPLMARVLGLEAATNSGSLAIIGSALK